LRDPKQSNVGNLNNVRREASRCFRNKKKEYAKVKIDEIGTISKIKNIRHLCRGISDFKRGYQPRINIVKVENGYLVTDSHNILGRWKNHFSQSLNVHGVNDNGQTEIQAAESLVPDSSAPRC
jgi:hypothetical protein